ncbi:alpha/beta hydrolase [Pseudofrankia sp. DC12]|uniref:alpha/beta fold hydrolase n=1 Tax=Pseudofrankia sp. DC12 TaxID=683315 RepID=UPI0006978749|nr:alpha/beta hydrolase [Pseudofrankia sp. DC12]
MAELVDVGGYKLAVDITGGGVPPVVFVSGLAAGPSEWDGALAAARVTTTRVAYGRPAQGGSGPLPPRLAETPRPASWAAAQLRTLLSEAAVPSPRVLVGHAIGGLIVEAYLARWPEETAGLVLVDPTEPSALLDRANPVLVAADHGAGSIHFDIVACAAEHRAPPPPARVPAVVVTSAVGTRLRMTNPDRLLPLSPAEVDARWQTFQREWAARTAATQIIADNAGHFVHKDAPDLVALAVDAVVNAARGHAPVRLDPAAVSQAGGRVPRPV